MKRKHVNGKIKTKDYTRFRKLIKEHSNEIMIILTLIIVFIAFSSALLATLAAINSAKSADYARETVEWYVSPKPLLCLETSAYYQILEKEYVSIINGSGYNPSLGVKSNISSHTTITLSFYNAGRIPAGTSNIMIEITNVTISNRTVIEKPFPFKILSITTSIDGFYYNEIKESFVYAYKEQEFTPGLWFHDDKVLDFPPVIVNGYINQLNRKCKLGTIYPQQGTDVAIVLFSTRKNASADLEISVKYCGKTIDEITTRDWKLKLAS